MEACGAQPLVDDEGWRSPPPPRGEHVYFPCAGGCECQSFCDPVVAVTPSPLFMNYSSSTSGVPGTVLGMNRGIRPACALRELDAMLTDVQRDRAWVVGEGLTDS